MVSKALRDCRITEQILHPDKYFNYERPVKVVVAGCLKSAEYGE